jgi:hypothetical protein
VAGSTGHVFYENMDASPFPKMDKSAFSVATLTAPLDERQYWLAKSPAERLEALEIMRQIIYGYDPLTTRLQRLFEVAQRT